MNRLWSIPPRLSYRLRRCQIKPDSPGIANPGCESNIERSIVVPDRPHPRMNTNGWTPSLSGGFIQAPYVWFLSPRSQSYETNFRGRGSIDVRRAAAIQAWECRDNTARLELPGARPTGL